MSELIGTTAATPTMAAAEVSPGRKGIGLATWLALVWLVIVLVAVFFAPLLPLHDPNESFDGLKEVAPFQYTDHILGGDGNGRDMLARVVYGARYSIMIAVLGVTAGFLVGGTLGLISGYFKGRVGNLLVGLFDIMLAIPQLVLALALVAVLKGDPVDDSGFKLSPVVILIIALGIVSIPIVARIARANTLTWSQREFVMASRAQGAKDWRVLFREVFPNVLPAMISIALLGIGVAIVTEGGLALLGASVEPPTSTWGTIITGGRSSLNEAPFIVMIPSIAILLTVLALNTLGDAIRVHFDVRESAL
jgi:peptide/nickel transport system permease protein